MPPTPDFIGSYKVVRELGRGAMGIVYLVHQESLGRDLAVKLMAPEFTRDPEFVERFRREGRIAARLRHHNIVHIHDFSDRDGLYYIAMEYLGPRNLADLVSELGPIEPGDAARLTDGLLAGLEHAHSLDVVHRDIKPANVMVTEAGEAVLTDFSVAHMKSASRLTVAGAVLGTPEYMAPEQFNGQSDGRSDVYATGVMLYEMLTGFSPFSAETIAEIMRKQLFDKPDAPHLVDFTIPQALSEVVEKSLTKDPNLRFQSAAEMRRALRAATEGLSKAPAAQLSGIRPSPLRSHHGEPAAAVAEPTHSSDTGSGRPRLDLRGGDSSSKRPAPELPVAAQPEPEPVKVERSPFARPSLSGQPVAPSPQVQPPTPVPPPLSAAEVHAPPSLSGVEEHQPEVELFPDPQPQFPVPRDGVRRAGADSLVPRRLGTSGWQDYLDEEGVMLLLLTGGGCLIMQKCSSYHAGLSDGSRLGMASLLGIALATCWVFSNRNGSVLRIASPLLVWVGLVAALRVMMS